MEGKKAKQMKKNAEESEKLCKQLKAQKKQHKKALIPHIGETIRSRLTRELVVNYGVPKSMSNLHKMGVHPINGAEALAWLQQNDPDTFAYIKNVTKSKLKPNSAPKIVSHVINDEIINTVTEPEPEQPAVVYVPVFTPANKGTQSTDQVFMGPIPVFNLPLGQHKTPNITEKELQELFQNAEAEDKRVLQTYKPINTKEKKQSARKLAGKGLWNNQIDTLMVPFKKYGYIGWMRFTN